MAIQAGTKGLLLLKSFHVHVFNSETTVYYEISVLKIFCRSIVPQRSVHVAPCTDENILMANKLPDLRYIRLAVNSYGIW